MSNPKLRTALEESILDNPDEIANHAAYADFLQDQGDPRGEFIQVQLALEDEALEAGTRKQLRKREKELLDNHHHDWLGSLAYTFLDFEYEYEFDQPKFTFAKGWLSSVNLPELTEELGQALARAPEAQLVRELRIDSFAEELWEVGLGPLAGTTMFGNLRVLQVGQESIYRVDSLPEFLRLSPRIESITLTCRGADLSGLFRLPNLHKLRELDFENFFDTHPLGVLAENPSVRSLERLSLFPHCYEEGYETGEPDPETSYLPYSQVQPFLRSAAARGLKHLALSGSSLGDVGCAEVVASGLLDTLEVLDLRNGCITDDGARILAECPSLPKLKSLDLSHNGLTGEGIRLLEATGVTLRAERQFSAEAIEQHEHLYQGDIE